MTDLGNESLSWGSDISGGSPQPQNRAATPAAPACLGCDFPLHPLATICPVCDRAVNRKRGKKTKTAAIVLAIFFGCGTWLYTFRRDKWKLTLGLGLNVICGLVALVLWPVLIFNAAVWGWAIVDTATKPKSCFRVS